MQTEILTSSIFGLLIIAEVIIVILTWLHRDNPTGKFWFTLTLIPVIGATALHLLPADFILAGIITRDYLIWLMLIMAVIAFGGLALRDLANDDTTPSANTAWMALSGLWLIAFAITGAISNPIFMGWGTWLDALPLVAGVTGGIGFVLYSLFLLGALGYSFYRASMPEIANRVAFWIVTSGAVLLSVIIVATGVTLYTIIGTIALYVSMFISLYGVRTYRLVDVRDAVLRIAQSLMVVLLVWVLVFATIYFLTSAQLETELFTDNPSGNIVLFALLSAVVAIAIVPARQVIRFFFSQLGLRKRPNLAQATAQYSQLVAKASTIEEVVNATTETLNRVMGVRRSALILINNTVRVKDSVELIVLEAGASLTNPTAVGYLHEKSPIYYTFAEHSTALGQFDMDYSPAFKHTAPQEKAFFRDMNLSVYVPISADNRLIGLVATGAKLNDTTYTRDDIETLTVIGQQVGTALRSARLIDDLQHLNDSMRGLNKRLENAKVELEKLDNIKTDFITIASHELRTPLAQIRGYTDILDSLNKANALKEGQADQLVGNLRKSTERMEELISAMLDVSQIDVNSMDLRFIRTSPETIIKMALEPLRDPAEERQIQIIRQSVKELPNIEADLQRMVQAIRNIVLNAIKFTPDGGTIEISAVLEPAKSENSVDNILFTIRDTGVGIDKKDIEFIFNKFYRAFDTQLHSTGIYKFMGAGPGLGLTIAKGIIEGHGGHIWAESTGHDMDNPKGSVFYVRLPVEPPSGQRRVSPFEDDMNRTQLPLSRIQ